MNTITRVVAIAILLTTFSCSKKNSVDTVQVDAVQQPEVSVMSATLTRPSTVETSIESTTTVPETTTTVAPTTTTTAKPKPTTTTTKKTTTTTVKPKPVASGSCKDWIIQAGITDVENAYYIVMKESTCNPNARNKSSGACGLVQANPCSKLGGNWSDPVHALKWADSYVSSRYGSWAGAVAHSRKHGWY